jgi:tetratricopeptide (TPR) repeat protein
MRLNPKDAFAFQNLSGAYLDLGRFDEAKAIVEDAISKKFDSIGVYQASVSLGFIQGEKTALPRALAWAQGTSDEAFILTQKASDEDALGKITQSQETWRQAIAAAERYGMKDFVGSIRSIQANRDASRDACASSHKEAEEAVATSEDVDTLRLSALSLARCGEEVKSRKISDDLSRQFPTNTMLHKVGLPLIEAANHLHRGQPAEAIAALELARPYELGALQAGGAGYFINYLRGQAYLQSRDGIKAAAEFQRILDHRGIHSASELLPLARLNLARAYAIQGDTAKARTAYQDALATWKDADADFIPMQQAKAEYAKLQ